MKKLLLEYANIIGYTVTGLIFGLSFFLIFVNFYHYEEINTAYDVSSYSATNKENAISKINTIKSNISVYDPNNYSGSLNVYGLNNMQLKLQACVEILESEDMMKYFDMTSVQLKDAYNFATDFNNKVLNDCIVMQIKSGFNDEAVSSLPNANIIKPYVDTTLNNLVSFDEYITSNLENADHYFFSTNNNKINFFNLTEDSYVSTSGAYQDTLDFLVEISNWYRTIVVGG